MIPLVNLKAQYDTIREEVDAAIQRVLDSGWFIQGPEVETFEKAFAAYVGTKYCVGTGCGLDALTLALEGLEIGPGDEVIIPANTFIATAFAISQTGATPVLVDSEFHTHLMNVGAVPDLIGPNTKAVMPVHLYGQCADMEYLKALQDKFERSFFIIEDACQAHGAVHQLGNAGSIGDAACFSFYPGKNLGAYGDGGALVTNNHNIAQWARWSQNYGQVEKYEHVIRGRNSRLDALHAAVLGVKLKKLDVWNDLRNGVAGQYGRLLGDVEEVVLPKTDKPNKKHVYHQYVVMVDNRDDVLSYLKAHNIGAAIHYPVPIHLQKCYQGLGYKPGKFPNAERAASSVISLPIFPEMTPEQVETVAGTLKAAIHIVKGQS